MKSITLPLLTEDQKKYLEDIKIRTDSYDRTILIVGRKPNQLWGNP